MVWFKNKKWKITPLLSAVLICTLAIALWLYIYNYDNKYTANGVRALNGLLKLDEQDLTDNQIIYLVDGWEYYDGMLLTPEDFLENPPTPNQYIFIGRFCGFEAGDKSKPSHGYASYRLLIQIPKKVQTYMLELPEIFSAYRLYINGKLATTMGNPDPMDYRPETGNQTIIIEAGGSIEILLAVSGYSHLYSGVVYPSAFGYAKAVSNLLLSRLSFRIGICASALLIGLISILVSLFSRKNKLAYLYGFLCVLFLGYVCSPVTNTYFTGFQIKYAIESFSFCAILTVAMLLVQEVCRTKLKWRLWFVLFGFLMCFLSVLGPLLWNIGNLYIMLTYSLLVTIYQWVTSLFLTVTIVCVVLKYTIHTKPLLYGILFFDTALIIDRLFPLYEPIVTGWFIELGCFSLILFIGVSIGEEVATQYKDAAILTERTNHLEKLIQKQQSYYTVLKKEMTESRKMCHDMRHHFTYIDKLVQNRQYEKLSSYVSGFQTPYESGEAKEYCPIGVINVLSHHYDAIALQNKIHLDIRYNLCSAEKNPETVRMSDADLCCLFSNLMENAMEACMRLTTGKQYIYAAIIRTSPDSLSIHILNSTNDKLKNSGYSFGSSKENNRQGYGLLSVQSIARKYNGEASFSWNKAKKEFESIVIVKA